MLLIISLILKSSFNSKKVTHAASSCYVFNSCGTEENPAVAAVFQTSSVVV